MNELYTYPDNDFRKYIIHSAKGTTWNKKDHKYIEKKDGRYIYADPKQYFLQDDYSGDLGDELLKYVKKKRNAKKVLKRIEKTDRNRLFQLMALEAAVSILKDDNKKIKTKKFGDIKLPKTSHLLKPDVDKILKDKSDRIFASKRATEAKKYGSSR